MLTPDEIASRQFLVSLRGYDRDEVAAFLAAVAEEHGQLIGRVEELEQQLTEARRSSASVERASSSSASTAPSAAVDPVGASQPVPAASSPRDAFAALGEETTRILVAAEESAQSIRDKAEERARVELENARREARDEVEGARRTASKIVADAERRRNTIAEDIRSLEATRDGFMGELRAAMKNVQGAVRGMQTTSGTTELQSGEDGDRSSDDESGRALAGERPRTDRTAEGATPSAADVTAPSRSSGPGASPAPAPAPDPDPLERPRTSIVEDDSGLDDDSDELSFIDEAIGADASDDRGPAAQAVGASEADQVEVDADDDDAVAASAVASAAATLGHDADEVTSSLDDGSEDASGAEPVDVAPSPEPEPEPSPAPPVVEASEPPSSAIADGQTVDPLALRQQSLSGVRPGMLRRLKRALQDVQNGVLDALRQAGDTPEVEALLPSDDDLAPIGAVGQMFLTAAYRAGLADGAIIAGTEQPDEAGDESRVPASSATFRAIMSHEVTAALRATLRAGIEADESEVSLSERVGEVFRDLKGPVVEASVDEHLTRVYGYGQLDVWTDLGRTHTTWVLGEEPRCPANACRTNVAEGEVAIGAEYPSGDSVPPAHDGCTCGLLPA